MISPINPISPKSQSEATPPGAGAVEGANQSANQSARSTDCLIYIIELTDPPRAGKRKPVVTRYAVAAHSKEEAAATFDRELPGHVELSGSFSITKHEGVVGLP